MSVRRKTENRLTLIRQCHNCGQIFATTAASPFIRQLCNVDGKKQKTCYFCSELCYASSYKHIGWYDGKAKERRKARDAARSKEKNRRYYEAHREKEKARIKQRYWLNHDDSLATVAFNRRKRAVLGI